LQPFAFDQPALLEQAIYSGKAFSMASELDGDSALVLEIVPVSLVPDEGARCETT
jgi:hypothetical protein